MSHSRLPLLIGSRWLLLLALVLAPGLGLPGAAGAQEASVPDSPPPPIFQTDSGTAVVAVVPFRVHSSTRYTQLSRSLSDLLAARLSTSQGLEVVAADRVRAALRDVSALATEAGDLPPGVELSDAELRSVAARLDADAVLTGSVTELAGRFSLDVRVVPATVGSRSHTIVFIAEGEEELLARVDDVADRVSATASRGAPGRIVRIEVAGVPDLETELRSGMSVREGDTFDPALLEADRVVMEENPGVASVAAETERSEEGVVVRFRVLPSAALFVSDQAATGGEPIVVIEVRGNRRIETGAVLSRMRTKVGEPLNSGQLAGDLREIYRTGYFDDIRVYSEPIEDGVVLVIEVEESPVVRQISISGNDKIEDEKIRDILTLTTGSTLDYPLLRENVERVEVLYRAEGYYLAEVGYELEELGEGSVAIHMEVDENEKLKLQRIAFEGNEHFSDKDLSEDLAIKRWRWYSPATSWFDKTGTYSEPIFLRDLQAVERKYSDAGYLQVEVARPVVDATEEGLFVTVPVREGPQFRVGVIDVGGDDTMDLDALRSKLRLSEGEVFNRSFLTADVESLERHYTDRGFYFAKVQPRTRLDGEEKLVDVEFGVEKGPLYFIRHVDIAGNDRTVDSVIRREMNLVEGQLYSARALRTSTTRVRNLGFFEDVQFEPKTTEDPAQLDVAVDVVERPTGSFSFGAGFSSQDNLVFTASLSQANLFGRGYGVNLSADVGGRTNRFFLSFSDPNLFDSNFSFGSTIFLTDVRFNDFSQKQLGFDFSLGHSLSEDNTSRGFLRYSYAQRRVRQNTGVNAAAPIFREILQGNESSSLVGLSLRRDTRDDRFAPTAGTNSGFTMDYAGLGGFAKFLRLEARHSWYMGAPGWLFKGSTFVVGARIGYVFPFNTVGDYDLSVLGDVPQCREPDGCVNVANLDQINTNLTLPLTERYFLGGIGTFQLRGFKARSVGPRRSILRRTGVAGTGDLFSPVGTQVETDPVTGRLVAICNDTPGGVDNQGNGNGLCNRLEDSKVSDFDDLRETDVVGGSKFFTATLEYRFPVSEEVGLQGILFFDMGGSFAESESLFDTDVWRYGTGFGVLWFSPFGPLQLVLGFPINPYSFEKSPVFEFSVGGFGL